MRERSGRTKKPCPGCGKVVPYRKVSEVCNECRKDIREGQSHRKSELAGQRKKELVIVQFPEYEHWLPSLHHASPAYGDHKYESHVRTTFLELAKAASEPASGEHVGEQLVAGTDRRYGTVGLDVNPDGVAVVETNKDGCPLDIAYVGSNRAMFARKSKRTHDVRQVAVETVSIAQAAGKHIVIEKLKFKNKPSKNRRFNRMRHNFLHRQMIEAIKSRAAKQGVGIIEVNPAFTSVIGDIKYAEQYGRLNRHTAAALVIARLGLGLKEVVRVGHVVSKKGRVTLEARTRRIALTQKSPFLDGAPV